MRTDAPWWAPDRHADRQPLLRARRRVVSAARAYFEERDFTEVETGVLQASPGNETHLHAFATEQMSPGGAAARTYLRTSPEFTCKKLLAAGERRIFELARVFRNREQGLLHAPEFTLLEWYRVEEPYGAVMQDCTALVAAAAAATGAMRFSFRGRSADPMAAPERLTVADAFARFAGIDLLATIAEMPDRDLLARGARSTGIRLAADDSWSDIFSRILVERIEPQLGNGRPTLLTEYPAAEAALARPKPGDPRIAERFEMFICGVELANGFGELRDPVEQRRRLAAEMDRKEQLYGERYPLDEDFLAALALMPPASGCALGFDRLVMLASGASRIDEVMWAPPAQLPQIRPSAYRESSDSCAR